MGTVRRRSRLFTKALITMIVLFGVIANAASLLYGRELYASLSAEYESKGIAIASSIADAAVELLLNRDVETIQATIDQFDEIGGVSYVLVADAGGRVIAHTFVPEVPSAVRALRPPDGNGVVTELDVEKLGSTLDVAVPILEGVAGTVRVGMDVGAIRSRIWTGVLRMQLLVFAIFLASIVAAVFLVRRISVPLTRLTEHTRAIAEGGIESDAPPDVDARALESKDEIGELARSFVRMEHDLRESARDLREATAARERLESELRIAREIQMNILPHKGAPDLAGAQLEIDASLEPAREVGGDLFDFFLADDRHLYFAVGDVSGKGMPAALFMAVTMTLLRATAQGARDPAEVLAHVNRELCRDNDACMFVTLFLGLLDLETGRMDYCSGGHNPPYRIGSDGSVEALVGSDGVLLGVASGASFRSGRVDLGPGDGLFLFTDGVTEAPDPAGSLFGELRLEDLLSVPEPGPASLTHRVLDSVAAFAAGAPPADDITVMALRYRAPRPAATVVRLSNRPESLDELSRALAAFARERDVEEGTQRELELVLEEVVTNLIRHGYADDAEHSIEVRLAREGRDVTIEIEDDGRPFDPEGAPPADTSGDLGERPIGGLGLHLVRTLMDEQSYRRHGDRNVLTLRKRIGPDSLG